MEDTEKTYVDKFHRNSMGLFILIRNLINVIEIKKKEKLISSTILDAGSTALEVLDKVIILEHFLIHTRELYDDIIDMNRIKIEKQIENIFDGIIPQKILTPLTKFLNDHDNIDEYNELLLWDYMLTLLEECFHYYLLRKKREVDYLIQDIKEGDVNTNLLDKISIGLKNINDKLSELEN